MFLDARRIPAGAGIDCDLCIIGAGVAGLAIAREFANSQNKVVLLEGGGLKADPASQSLYAGENIGLTYERLDRNRSRYFGGSSNCWGGWCRPFDEIDLQHRPWVSHSGWPLSAEQLQPYYRRANAFFGISPHGYDPSAWQDRLADETLRLMAMDGRDFENIVVQFARPPTLGQVYRQEFQSWTNVSTLLHANVARLTANENSTEVREARVQTLSGNAFAVRANRFVLAAGGIENARILLLSKPDGGSALGNDHDLVGRFFSDHPRRRHDRIRLRDPQRNRRLYDVTLVSRLRRNNIHHVGASIQFGPTAEAQARHCVQNSRSFLVAEYQGDGTPAVEQLRDAFRTFPGRAKFGIRLEAILRQMTSRPLTLASELPQIAAALIDNKFNPASRPRSFRFETMFESSPNPDSRVLLSDERDQLGLPKARVDLRLNSSDLDAFERTQALIKDALTRDSSLAEDLSWAGEPADGPLLWSWHHMGTTRMHDSPRQGVVDPDCKVHGVANLFVAGSSVFPTFGNGTPTLTIAALALRLADRLKAEIGTA